MKMASCVAPGPGNMFTIDRPSTKRSLPSHRRLSWISFCMIPMIAGPPYLIAPILRKTRARSLNLAGWSSISGLLSETGETHSGPARTVAASSDRKAEGHTEADFAKRLVVELRAAQADVEGDVVAHLPDRANQRRPCRQANEIPLVEDLRDGSQRPVMRAFDDHPEERIRGLLSGDGDGGVEMDGHPRPLLRHDSSDAAAGSTARIVIDAGQ